MAKRIKKAELKEAIKNAETTTPEEYRDSLNRMFSDSSRLDKDYADIQKMYNGESIFDEEKLKEFGIDLEGVNFLTMRSIMDNITLGYVGEFLSNTRLFRFTSKYYTRLARQAGSGVQVDDVDASVLSNQQVFTVDRRNSEALDYAVNKMLRCSNWWKKFQKKEVHETQLHGLSYAVWADKTDPTPKLYPRYRVKIHAQTTCDLDTWDSFAVESSYTFEEIYKYWLKASAKAKKDQSVGWQAQNLAEFLFWHSKYRKQNHSTLKSGTDDFSRTAVDYVHKLRTGSLNMSTNHSGSFLLYNIYRKNIEGGIDRVIIDKDLTHTGFLLFNPNDRKSFKDIIYPFTRKPWIDYLLEQVGIGNDIFAPDQVIEELTSYSTQHAKLASGVIINSPEGENQSSEPIDIIPGVGISAGNNQISSNAIGTNLQAVTAFITFINNKLSNNLITSGYNVNINDLEFNNDKQIEMFAFREARSRKNIFDLYYENLKGFMEIYLDKLLSSEDHPDYQRLIDLLEEKVDNTNFLLEEGGLPESLSFEVSKSAGTGSQFADQIMADRLLRISGRLGPDEQDILLKMYISAYSSPEIAEELTNKRLADNNSKSKDEFDAILACNQLEQGFQLPNSMDHDPLIFANALIERINAIIKAYQEGRYGETKVYSTPEFQHLEGIPQETQAEQAFNAIIGLYSSATFHVSRMVGDPMNEQVGLRFKAILGELLNPLKQIEARAGQDAQARQTAIEQRLQQASEIKFENELERMKALAKIQNEQIVTQSKIEQRQDMNTFNKFLKTQKLLDDRELRSAELATDRELEALDISQKNTFENMRRRSEVNNG